MRTTTTRIVTVALATGAALVGFGFLDLESSLSTNERYRHDPLYERIVIGPPEKEHVVVAQQQHKQTLAWLAPPPVDHEKDSGDIIPLKDAVKRSLDRFDAITDSTQSYTLKECGKAAIRCGRACGSRRDEYGSCWCVRIWKKTVSYLPKAALALENSDGEDEWNSVAFQNLHMTLNLLWATLQSPLEDDDDDDETMRKISETALYLVVNVYDYPRLFVPQPPDSNVPTVTLGHPAETNMGYGFFSQVAFQGGFPDSLEACQEQDDDDDDDDDATHCCRTKRHFPVFSWSVNPIYNFDIPCPNRHAGSCMEKLFKNEITEVPWEEKTRTLVHRGSDKCHALQLGDHRARFCAHVQAQRVLLEQTLNVQINVHGDQVEPMEQARAKFLVLLDGAVAAFRSTWYLSTGSVILATGTHVDVRTLLLRPYVHYIPFRPDYSDFAQALALVANNDEYAKWVGENARRAGRILSQRGENVVDGGHEGDKLYWRALLKEYHKRYEFLMDDQELESKFTTDTKCEDFKQAGGNRVRNDKCLGEEYACQGKIQDGFLAADNVLRFLDREEEAAARKEINGGEESEGEDKEEG